MVATILNSRYRLGDMLGEGGMGQVWLAVDVELSRDVAIKVVKRELDSGWERLEEEIRQEARLAGSLQHPGIAVVHDVGVVHENGGGPSAHIGLGRTFVVMEYLAGHTVGDLLAGAPDGLPVPSTIEVGAQLAEALAYGHQKEIIHRDVKPSNVMVLGQGSGAWVKLCDYGIARLVSAERRADTSTMRGTPAYMAPEQASGGAIGAYTDLYALGALLYQMLTGTMPPPAVIVAGNRVMLQDPSPERPSVRRHRPDIPEELEQLICGLLQRDPEKRPQSAADVAENLRRIGTGAAAPASPPPLSLLRPTQALTRAMPTRAMMAPRIPRYRLLRRWRTSHPGTYLLTGFVLAGALAGAGAALYEMARRGEHFGLPARPASAAGPGLTTLGALLLVATLVRAVLQLVEVTRRRRAKKTVRRQRRRLDKLETGVPARVNVLMLGFSGSGKTTMLAALYKDTRLGGPDGIRFELDGDEAEKQLQELVERGERIEQDKAAAKPGSAGTTVVSRYLFNIKANGVKAFTIVYHDFPGAEVDALLNRSSEQAEEQFRTALADAQVLLGVLDGRVVQRLMNEGYDQEQHDQVSRLLTILAQQDKLVHLVISKWDLVRDPRGRPYRTGDIVARLDAISPDFRAFRSNPRAVGLRIIRVSAYGLDEPDRGTGPGPAAWCPWHARLPVYCALRDVVRDDIEALVENDRTHVTVQPVTQAVLAARRIPFTTRGGGRVRVRRPGADLWVRLSSNAEAECGEGQLVTRPQSWQAIGYVFHRCCAEARSLLWH